MTLQDKNGPLTTSTRQLLGHPLHLHKELLNSIIPKSKMYPLGHIHTENTIKLINITVGEYIIVNDLNIGWKHILRFYFFWPDFIIIAQLKYCFTESL